MAMTIIKCPDCGKLISLLFPMHTCVPRKPAPAVIASAPAPAIRIKIRRYLGRWPNRTSTQIARAIHQHPATVSSILNRMYKRGLLIRTSGCGVRGGYGWELATPVTLASQE